jgi:hypothetical protein
MGPVANAAPYNWTLRVLDGVIPGGTRLASGNAVTNLSTKAKNNILRMQADSVEPIRMLYDVLCNDIKSSDDATGKQLFRSGSITITAKELVRQIYFGPDNVPTTAY